MSYRINVSLICRNSIVREGLSRILSERDFRVTQFSSLASTLPPVATDFENEGATLLLIDNGSEECDAGNLSALRAQFPGSHVVLLSDHFDLKVMLQAFQLGIRAYIVKEISCDRLAGTLRLVAMGERVLPPQLADELQSRPGLIAAAEVELSAGTARLSMRESEILRWLIMGCPNKVISRQMDISEATVKVHVKAILRKLSVKNRTQAAIWAANNGMRGRSFDVEPELDTSIPHPAQIAASALVEHASY
jgi:two-component system nitrate/nitrite response regulator NarL|uniref:LuxR C-terminal-related transcriptional regulator n=1 Tax=uncultured Sphingomonas sp. TaxID=158754 RepID=UPI0035CC5160